MNTEKTKEKINWLIKSYFNREKIIITPDDLGKLNVDELRAWVWFVGMGSDACLLFVKNDGTVLEYNHYDFSRDFNSFVKAEQDFLAGKDGVWLLHECRFGNRLYVCAQDKTWFDECWNDFLIYSGSPLIYIELLCKKISEE